MSVSPTRPGPFTSNPVYSSVTELRWSPLTSEDKREFSRKPSESDLWLLDLEGLTVLRCRTDNLSPRGLHATVPIGFGLAVGQRYELRLRCNDAKPPPMRPGWSACYGTIIRTQLLPGGNMDRLSIAIRFDTPQFDGFHCDAVLA